MRDGNRVEINTLAGFMNDCKYVTQDQIKRYFGLNSQGGIARRLNFLTKDGYVDRSKFGGVLVYFLTHKGYMEFITKSDVGYYRPAKQTIATADHTFMETEYRIFAKRCAGMKWVYGARDILKKKIRYGGRQPDGLVSFVDYAYALEFELSHKSAARVWNIRSKYNIELERQRLLKTEPDDIAKRLKGVIVVGPNEYVLSKYMDPVFHRVFAVCLISDLQNCVYYNPGVTGVKCWSCGSVIKTKDKRCPKCRKIRSAARSGVGIVPLRKRLIELQEENSP